MISMLYPREAHKNHVRILNCKRYNRQSNTKLVSVIRRQNVRHHCPPRTMPVPEERYLGDSHSIESSEVIRTSKAAVAPATS